MALNDEINKFYVYHLIDPRDNKPFYVGKGCGRRVFSHVKDAESGRITNARKHEKISEILKCKLSVIEKIVQDGLTEPRAYEIERIEISKHKDLLTNIAGGNCTNANLDRVRAKQLLDNMLPYNAWIKSARKTALDFATEQYGSPESFYNQYKKKLQDIADGTEKSFAEEILARLSMA